MVFTEAYGGKKAMCDYSLYSIQNRLAEQGEELVLHKFETGSVGFASAPDLLRFEAAKEKESSSFWSAMRDWLLLPPRTWRLPAICVPPGTRLLITDIPQVIQKSLCIQASEIVVFTELHSRTYSYRDALLLPNATRVLLQDLPEGIHALVLSALPDSSMQAVPVEVHAA
jgi:hypothetical protein